MGHDWLGIIQAWIICKWLKTFIKVCAIKLIISKYREQVILIIKRGKIEVRGNFKKLAKNIKIVA